MLKKQRIYIYENKRCSRISSNVNRNLSILLLWRINILCIGFTSVTDRNFWGTRCKYKRYLHQILTRGSTRCMYMKYLHQVLTRGSTRCKCMRYILFYTRNCIYFMYFTTTTSKTWNLAIFSLINKCENLVKLLFILCFIFLQWSRIVKVFI